MLFTCGEVFVSVFEAVDRADVTAFRDSSSEQEDFALPTERSIDISAQSTVSSMLFCVVVSGFFSNVRNLRYKKKIIKKNYHPEFWVFGKVREFTAFYSNPKELCKN